MPEQQLGLVVGLGNPGDEYQNTRHNIGFMLVDAFLDALPRVPNAPEHMADSWVWTCRYAGRTLRLQKPLTYMNCSGTAVAKVVRRHDLKAAEILVVYDDIDLPLGRLRLRRQGGSGGHRGIESIIAELGSSAFCRLRLGIGRSERDTENTVDHVLGAFTEAEEPARDWQLKTAVKAVQTALRCGVEHSMNKFNGMVYGEPDPAESETDEN